MIKIHGIDLEKIYKFMLHIGADECNFKRWATWYDIDSENTLYNVVDRSVPELKLRALMKYLGKQGFVHGCHCGCRGDYELTIQAHAFFEISSILNSIEE